MNLEDAGRVLAVAAAYDRRTIGKADLLAWADALDDLDPTECITAIRAHYREQTAWCMPAHVRQLIAQAHREAAERRRNQNQLRAIDGAKHDAQQVDHHSWAQRIRTELDRRRQARELSTDQRRA